jgi:hypothetical protein
VIFFLLYFKRVLFAVVWIGFERQNVLTEQFVYSELGSPIRLDMIASRSLEIVILTTSEQHIRCAR